MKIRGLSILLFAILISGTVRGAENPPPSKMTIFRIKLEVERERARAAERDAANLSAVNLVDASAPVSDRLEFLTKFGTHEGECLPGAKIAPRSPTIIFCNGSNYGVASAISEMKQQTTTTVNQIFFPIKK